MSSPTRRPASSLPSSSPSSSPSRSRRAPVVALVAAAGLALAGVTGCGGPDSLNGTLQTADAKGKDGAPLSGGWIAVLTEDQVADFFTQSGIDQPTARGLAFVEGRVRHEAIAETGGTLVPVDDDGKFTTTVTGPRRLCVLRELPQVDVLRGCAAVDLPAKGSLDITVGDDGVAATLRD
jgi:hypothetical protein